MNLLEKVTIQAFHRKRLGNDAITELGYRTPESQQKRFESLCTWGDMTGCTVMDLGCGYGDLKPFLDTRFTGVHYLGIDFLKEFVEGARARYGQAPGTQFIEADFFTAGLPEVDVVMASGSLNYRSQNPAHPWEMIGRMWESAHKGVAFNLLNTANFPEHPLLCGYEPEAVLTFCRGLTSNTTLVSGYLPDDFTIFMYR